MKKRSYLPVKLKARVVKKSHQTALNMPKITREKMLGKKTEMLGKMRKAANLSKKPNSSQKKRPMVSYFILCDKNVLM